MDPLIALGVAKSVESFAKGAADAAAKLALRKTDLGIAQVKALADVASEVSKAWVAYAELAKSKERTAQVIEVETTKRLNIEAGLRKMAAEFVVFSEERVDLRRTLTLTENMCSMVGESHALLVDELRRLSPPPAELLRAVNEQQRSLVDLTVGLQKMLKR